MAKQDILKKDGDQIWLVKSSDSILGPFTTNELAQNVRTKIVGLLDEARTPSARWIFIRDIPEIQSTISKLAQQEDTFEKTNTMTMSNLGNLTVTRNIADDNTPVPHKIPIVSTPPPVAEPVTPIKRYSLNPPTTSVPWRKWGFAAVIGFALFIVLIIFVQKKSWEYDQKKTWTEFQQYYAAHLYDDAYKKLKDYQKEFPDQATALTRAGLLFLNPGRELVNARRMFERSTQLDPDNKDLMVQNLNGLGLVALYEGQLVQAKSNFDRALTLEPSSILTRLNLVSLYMNQGKWNEVLSLSQHVAEVESKKAYLIQAALSLLSPNYSERSKIVTLGLGNSIDSSSYLRPIMRFMMIRLMSNYNDIQGMESQIKQFFEDLPSLHVTFAETPLLDQRWRDWNFLYQFCNDLKSPNSSSNSLEAEILSIKIICVTQIQKWNEAERMVNEGMKRFPNSNKILLARLHLLTLMQRWPDIRAIMRMSSLTSDLATNWMFAKSCLEEKNSSCTDLYLKPLLQKNQIPTAVYELEAKQNCIEKASDNNQVSEQCRFALTQGLLQDPLAYGLLKIRSQIENGL